MKRSEMVMLAEEVLVRSLSIYPNQEEIFKGLAENLLDTLEENGMEPPSTENYCEDPDGGWHEYTTHEWEPEDEQ
jgi:hypothetical protein